MSAIRTALANAREHRGGGEDGFSLMETIVAMSIFAIFMSTAMAAIISMMTSTQKSQSLTDGATQLENAFQRLDHQVRYADSVNSPTLVGTNWFVEWHTQATSTTPTMCAQLKYNSAAQTLLERTWSPTAVPIVATAWYQVAKNVVNNVTSQPPFIYTGTKATGGVTILSHQQLALDLFVRPNGLTTARSESSETQVSFTALNSTTKSSSSINCQEVGRP